MRERVIAGFAVVALMGSALLWSGCSSQAQKTGRQEVKAKPQAVEKLDIVRSTTPPSYGEVIRAIDDSGAMKRADGSFTVVPPVKVVHRGTQNKEGAWPVMAQFTLIVKTKDGHTTPPSETTSAFRVYKVKDASGKAVWRAQMGT